MSDLPFKKEEGFDYILDEADRKRFAPKLATDEIWCADRWIPLDRSTNPFLPEFHYRRRKSSGWVSVKERLPELGEPFWFLTSDTKVPGVVPKGVESLAWFQLKPFVVHWRYCEGDYQIPPAPQPPRPAAEVAFDSIWPELFKTTALTKQSAYSFFKVGYDAAIESEKTNKEKL